jgi:hypothetical protein
MSSTKPIRVITYWERFKRSTVWHPINTDPDDVDRYAARFWFPVYDLIAFALGVYALVLGSPLLNRLFPAWFTDSMGVVLMLASATCLIGVVFPKLGLMELIGKLAIIFMLGGYAGTVATLSNTNENGFVVLVLVMSVWLLGPRVTRLFTQTAKLRAARARKKAL